MYVDHTALAELVQLGMLICFAGLVACWVWAKRK